MTPVGAVMRGRSLIMLSYIPASLGSCHQEHGAVVLWLFARQFFMAGVCGAYTAFSLFSLPTPAFAKEDEWFRAVANLIAAMSRRRFGHVFAMPEKPKKE
jgi:hypothetical protein